MKSVALLGTGTMGSGMARRLMGAGFAVTVWNRTRSRAEALAADGARLASTPREAAAAAEAVISMLADDNAAHAAWLGGDGALSGARPGTVLIESSTVSLAWAKQLHDAAEARGCPMLDAPVTGSKPQAQNGELTFLVGGDAATLDRVRLVLAPMSRGVVYLGQPGSGVLMKLINNFLCGVQAASLAEAVATIESSGLDRSQALDVLCNGAPGSPLVRTLRGRMEQRDYTTNFATKLMAKDLRYAVKEASGAGVTLETGAAGLRAFEAAVDQGYGEQDMSSVVEPLRARTTGQRSG
jgi:3-hydroxyisobutyrate dehydrogenase